MDTLKKAVFYKRVSYSDQVENYSLATQEAACRKEAQRQGYELVKGFVDKGISAKTIDDRPGLLALMHFVKDKKNRIDACFILHSSRISRNTMDFLTLRVFFSKVGVLLISVNEPMISGTDPTQTFISTVLAATAQLDNDLRGANVKRGMKARFESGLPPSCPPLGYLPGQERRDPPVADPVWFPILQKMWQRIKSERLTLGQVVVELNRLKLKKFVRQSVHSIFTNRFYAGSIYSKTFKQEVIGKHTAMIDDETFYSVRAILSGKAPHKAVHSRLRNDFFLREILTCHICGRNLTSCYSKGRSKRYGYYLCSNRKHEGVSIRQKTVDGQGAEQIFINILKDIKPTPARMKYLTEFIKEKYHNRYETAVNARDRLQKDVEDLEEALKIARKKNLKSVYTDEEYLQMKDEYQTEIIAKKAALSERQGETVDIETLINFMTYYLNNLDSAFLKASPQGRVKIAGSIVPNGVQISDLKDRTITLGRQYYQIATSRSSRQFKYALIAPDRTINPLEELPITPSTSNVVIEEWFFIYNQLHKFIDVPRISQ